MLRPRLFVLRCVLALSAIGGTSNALAAEVPLNLLFFGNSFSQGGGTQVVPNKVGQLAAADGHAAPNIIADLLGGADLDYHIGQVANFPANNVNHASISGKTWNFVIQQGYSTEATHMGAPGGPVGPADFIGDALTLHNAVKNHASGRGAGVRSVLYQTWARSPNHSYYPTEFANPAAMQQEVRTNYRIAADGINDSAGPGSARIATVGDAFEAMDFSDGLLYGSDDYHASSSGYLLASMVLYRTIYSEDVTDISWSSASGWANVSQSTWNQLAAVADALPLASVPEPTSIALIAMGAAAALTRRTKRCG
ncbi:MAG TPA: PEP-CTERM sorting domain-containing protein [Tepidisphaeraceae bacterium]|jgi:hypothetical protein|nr:PEP-CTERM sorting domain-containing protein [Tepidisphaeraceae bacterium]